MYSIRNLAAGLRSCCVKVKEPSQIQDMIDVGWGLWGQNKSGAWGNCSRGVDRGGPKGVREQMVLATQQDNPKSRNFFFPRVVCL